MNGPSRRSRRRAATPPPVRQTPLATLNDAAVVVQLADIGAVAISAAAAERGLTGDPWDPDALHKPIAEIVARALRRTPDWWAGRSATVGPNDQEVDDESV